MLLNRPLQSLVSLTLLMMSSYGSVLADIVTLEVTIESSDATKNKIKVTRKGKVLSLDVDKKAKISKDGKPTDLQSIESRVLAEIEFESTLEIVTKIDIKGLAPAKPELVRLSELDTEGSEDKVWVSHDGLTIVWQSNQGRPLNWIAKRENAGVSFTSKKELIQGLDATLTSDGNELIMLVESGKLWSARRKNNSESFQKFLVEEFKDLPYISAPTFSENGLTLYLDQMSPAGMIPSVSKRKNLKGVWSKPTPIKMTVSEYRPRFPHVSTDGKYLLTMATTFGKQEDKPNLLVFYREDPSQPFQEKGFVTVDGMVLHGKFPRYIQATKELFFTRKSASGQQEIVVLKNFDPTTMVSPIE